MKPEFVHATRALAEAFYGRPAPRSFRGWVVLLDKKPVGIGGLYTDGGYPMAFSDLKEELRPHRGALIHGVGLMRKMLRDIKVPVFAAANPDEGTAPRLLAHLGFKSVGVDTPDGALFMRPPE
jgi:hypothetical protein